jgi:hypothetical protein
MTDVAAYQTNALTDGAAVAAAGKGGAGEAALAAAPGVAGPDDDGRDDDDDADFRAIDSSEVSAIGPDSWRTATALLSLVRTEACRARATSAPSSSARVQLPRTSAAQSATEMQARRDVAKAVD